MFENFIPNLVYGIISTLVIAIISVKVARLSVGNDETKPEPTQPVHH